MRPKMRAKAFATLLDSRDSRPGGAFGDVGLLAAEFFHFVARDAMRAIVPEQRLFDEAALVRDRAARVEAARLGRIHRRRYVAGQDDPLAPRFDAWVRNRDRRQQR